MNMNGRNEPCWCGSGKKWKKCHYPNLPSNDSLAERYFKRYGILLKTKEQIEGIERACLVTSEILALLCSAAQKGVTTLELDQLSRKLHQEKNAIPAPLGYGNPPFPMTICTSLNEVICHGIPSNRALREGDILNIDVSCIVEGFFGDASRMVCIGKIDEEKQRVVDVSLECLEKAIAVCGPGVPLFEIGQAIESHAKKRGCSVVNQFIGHGVGIAFHEAPEVPHHFNEIAIPMAPGMTFTIEPMINAGVRSAIIDKEDQWTARTADGKPSAQWEHTILITEEGARKLTSFRQI